VAEGASRQELQLVIIHLLARDGRIEPLRAPLSTKERRLGLIEIDHAAVPAVRRRPDGR
jgi:hypothetical protein